MKNYYLLFLLVFSFAFAQEQNDSLPEVAENSIKTDRLGNEIDYNRWSISGSFGINKAISPFREGFYSSQNFDYFGLSDNYHFDLGVNYMFNPLFGLKLDGAYDIVRNNGINEANPGTSSGKFKTNVYRVGIQGIINFGNFLNFDSFTNRLGVIGHAGGFISIVDAESNTEDNGGFMFGLTPYYKITNRLDLTADFTYLLFVRQHLNFDGSFADRTENLTGSMITGSIGLTYHIGKFSVDALDKTIEDGKKQDKILTNKLEELEQKIAETNNIVDEKNNDMKNYILNNYYNKNQVDNLIPSLRDFGFGNIFFPFDSAKPEASSINEIGKLVDYLKNNPSQNIELIGYTDILGSEAYNDGLSLKRAKYVNDILVESGIDQSRIDFNGDGVNPDFTNKKDDFNRMLARRVMVLFK